MEYDVDIKPTKLVKGQGLSKLLTESNCQVLNLHLMPENLEQDMAADVIHLNGTSSSKCRHSSCWHTKGHLWIEGCLKNYRWAYYELHLSSIQLVIFYLRICQVLYAPLHICNSCTYVPFIYKMSRVVRKYR